MINPELYKWVHNRQGQTLPFKKNPYLKFRSHKIAQKKESRIINLSLLKKVIVKFWSIF